MNANDEKGYGCFVMAVAGTALLIALIALRKWDGVPISSADICTTDILSILVTILIAGQLWQSMITREDLKRVNNAVNEVKRLKAEIEQARELPQGIYWNLLGKREQFTGNIASNRLAIQFYAESLKHFVKAQADFNLYIKDSLTGMRTCIHNIRKSAQFIEFSDEIISNINIAEVAISQMSNNLKEAFDEINCMRIYMREF